MSGARTHSPCTTCPPYLGTPDVRTYGRSSRVGMLFSTRARAHRDVWRAKSLRGLKSSSDLKVPVILRTAQQLRDVVSNNPFLKPGSAEETLHVMFLADRPIPAKIATLDPNRSSPDAFIVRGQEIYLNLPNGGGKSKLTNAWFDAKLSTVSTIRNWRTVSKLLAMMEG